MVGAPDDSLPGRCWLGRGDHGRVQIQAGHLQPVLVGEPDRQVAGSAADLQDPCAVRGDRRDVGRDAIDERAEQEPAQGVVGASMANQNSSRHCVSLGGLAALSQDGDGRGGRSGQDHQLPRSAHHTSTR
jgi:hypothetical protein